MNIPVGRLPVVDKEGKMVGWLTRTDLASAFLDHYKKSIEGLWNIIDSTAYGILAIDSNGIITVFNKTAERLWGVQTERIIGMHVQEIFPTMKMDTVLKTGDCLSIKLQVDGKLFNIDISPVTVNGQVEGAVAQFLRPHDQ